MSIAARYREVEEVHAEEQGTYMDSRTAAAVIAFGLACYDDGFENGGEGLDIPRSLREEMRAELKQQLEALVKGDA